MYRPVRALRVVGNLAPHISELLHGAGCFFFRLCSHPVTENSFRIVQIVRRNATCAAPRFVLPLVLHFICNRQRIFARLQIHIRGRRAAAEQTGKRNHRNALRSPGSFHHLRRPLPLSLAFIACSFALHYCALSETWNDHNELNIIPPRWLRATSPPENFSVFETGRSTTAYSPGNSADCGDIWYSPTAVFCRFTATRSSTNDE